MIVENEYAPDIRVEREAQALSDFGFEIHILAFTHGRYPKIEKRNNITFHRFHFSRLLFKKLAPLALTFPFYFWKWHKPLKTFLSLNFDVVHLHDLPLVKPVQELQKKYGFKCIVDLHENRPAIMNLYSHVQSIPGKWLISIKKWEEYQRKYLEKSNGIIVVTKEAKDQLLRDLHYNPRKMIAVMNTVDIAEFRKIPVKENIINKFAGRWNIVYVGLTGKRRGIDVVIRAIELVKEQIPEINFIVVGSGREDEEIKNLTRQLGVDEQVFFAGWVPSREINSYIQASHVGISPIRRNPHHDTTLANKITQYLALGKPILVSDCPAQAGIVESYNCGLIFRDGDAENLAERILFLYRERENYKQMQKNALTASENLDWRNEQKKLIRIYKELLSNEQPS